MCFGKCPVENDLCYFVGFWGKYRILEYIVLELKGDRLSCLLCWPRYINAAFGCESILQPHGNERGSGRHHHASGSLIWVGCCHQKGPPPFKQQSGGPRMGKRNGKGHEPLRVPSKLVSNGNVFALFLHLLRGL